MNGGSLTIVAVRDDGVEVPIRNGVFTTDELIEIDCASCRIKITPAGGATYSMDA